VIGTRLGGHVDMLTPESGILVPQGDVTALTTAMQELIVDPERRERMGRAAAERAKTFAATAVLPRFEQAYRDAIESGRERPGAS
jgi:glycosyltransferase involved in cell wall biosynthesis